MKPLLLVTAPVGTRSGYGSHSRDICRSLIAMDKFDVKIWPVRWGSTPQDVLSEDNSTDVPIIKRLLDNPNMDRQPDIHFHIVVPNEFQTWGKYNIGITAGAEFTAIRPEWIEGLNRMDLNIVPSELNWILLTLSSLALKEGDSVESFVALVTSQGTDKVNCCIISVSLPVTYIFVPSYLKANDLN